ncbi:hypothetical protein TrVFT333_008097 [Trichoderma virens FT-333]|nr:hypothetical protein TrVFT333_008097 [Trichoderma virens FT-333]
MITSLDKVARQQDFDMIARSGIMADYPDFGLGHSDFNATTTLVDGPSSQHDGASGGHQLNSRSSADFNIRTVTSGGVSHGGRHMLPTSHALRESSSIELPAQTSEASQTSESEFNGDEDQEKDLVKITWQDMPYELIPQSSHLEKHDIMPESKEKNESNYKTDATYTDSGYTGSKYTINSLGTADSGYTGSKYTAESVYTDDAEPSSTKKYEYISSFASDLLSNVATKNLDDESIDIICQALPQLLKSFAEKIGSYGTMQIYRDVMVFVRRYRREIAKKMKDAYLEENNKRPDIINNSKESATYKDRVENWCLDMGNLEDPNEALSEDTSILMDDELDCYYDEDFDEANRAVDPFPEISVYKKFLSELPVYKWLLSNIHRVLSMDIPGDVQINIRQSILQHLSEPQRVSRGQMPQRYNFKFIVDWDPCLFLREQGYLERPEIAVARAITITGSETDTQATTTTQYLNQMWPSSGVHLLDLLKVVVQDTCTLPYSCNFPDGTQLTVLSHGPRFTLQVNGISESIVEIGEQLTWLASALRSSPSQTEIFFVEARVKSEQLEEGMKGPNAKYLCNVSFVESPIVTSETANGQCWHQLFQKPVVVKGYSIPRRPTQHMGLEISLDIMAALAGTDRINTFDKKIFIKGFSTMMVPTGYSDNVILWHLFYNKEGGRISYLDSKMSHFEGLGLSDVESGRHILGWCSEVRCLSGKISTQDNYT